MKKIIISTILFLGIIPLAYGAADEDLEKVKGGARVLMCVDVSVSVLSHIALGRRFLQHSNFFCTNASHADFSFSDLSGSQMSYANLTNANLTNAKLIKAYLIRTNLTKANLTNADLRGAYLKAAKLDSAIVRGANFKGVKGLTNEQKKYLRGHGAINVPIDIEYDLESEESKKVGREVKKVGFLRKLSRHFFHKKQHDVATQTTK